jgi:hypothetical protein
MQEINVKAIYGLNILRKDVPQHRLRSLFATRPSPQTIMSHNNNKFKTFII